LFIILLKLFSYFSISVNFLGITMIPFAVIKAQVHWRSDGAGGFIGSGPGADGQAWASNRLGGFIGSGPGLENHVWRTDAKGGYIGSGPGLWGLFWRTDSAGGFKGFGGKIQGIHWRSDGWGGFNVLHSPALNEPHIVPDGHGGYIVN